MTGGQPEAKSDDALGAIGKALLQMLGGACVMLLVITINVVNGLWSTWWLHPLWYPVFSPLGVPSITFWHFLAMMWFVAAVRYRKHQVIKDEMLNPYNGPMGLVTTYFTPPMTNSWTSATVFVTTKHSGTRAFQWKCVCSRKVSTASF